MSVLAHWLNRLAERYLELFLTAAWQSTLVAVAVLVAVVLLRRRSAHLRYGLLLVVLVKFALPPVVQAPWSPFPRIARTTVTDAVEVGTTARWSDAEGADAEKPLGAAERRYLEPEFVDTESLSGVVAAKPDVAFDRAAPEVLSHSDPQERQSSQVSALPRDAVDGVLDGQAGGPQPLLTSQQAAGERLTFAGCLLLVQLLGTAVLLFALVVDAARLRCLIHSADPAAERHRQALGKLVHWLRMRRKPRLLVSDRCRYPFACGLLCPVIVLPRHSLHRLNPAELEAVLVHELLHLRRGDLWVNLLQLSVRAFWWWHPLVWWLHRQMTAAREDCCDDALLVRGWVDASRYCETLLAVARDAVAAGPSGLSVSMAAAHPLGRRLRRIMDSKVSRSGRIRFGSALMLVGLAIVVLPTVPPAQPAGSVESTAVQDAGAASAYQECSGDVGGANEVAAEAANAEPADAAQPSFQVLDEKNRPVAGVHLAISYGRGFLPFWVRPLQVWSTTTDDDGRPRDPLLIEIPVDQPVYGNRLWVYRPGVGLATVALPLHQPLESVPDQIRLANARSTVFTVETADGRPASGIQVRIRSFRGDGGTAWLPDGVADALTATTDAQGTVRLPEVYGGWIGSVELTTPQGAKELIGIHPRSDADQPPVWPQRIVLGPTGQVSGRVRGLAGEDRESARVSLISQSSEGLVTSDENQEVSHTRYVDLPVDAEGGFRGPAVPVGPLAGRIYRDTQWLGAIASGDSVRQSEETVMELQTAKLALVRFPVIDAETEMPIEAARVLASGSNNVEISAVGRDGDAPAVRLPRGAIHNYSFYLPDEYLPLPWGAFEVAVPEDVETFTAPTIRIRPGGRIRGTVLQPDGAVADGRQAVASWAADPQQVYSMPGSLTAQVDGDGSYELRVPKDEPFNVRIVFGGSVVAAREDITWQTYREQPLNFFVPAAENVSISGRVVDELGEPVSGVSVTLERHWTDGINSFGFQRVASARTDEFGTYRLPGEYVAEATYRARLNPVNDGWESDESAGIQSRDGQGIVMKDLRVRRRSSAPADEAGASRGQQLDSAVELRVRVSDAEGQPVEGARVTVWSAGQRSLRRTDAAGQAEVAVRSVAWVIAGGVERSDHTGRFVEDPSEAVEIVLPGHGQAQPLEFSDAPIPAPLRATLRDAVEALLRRIIAKGPEYQRAQALDLLAEFTPETALQSAAAYENSARRAALQGKLALQVGDPLQRQLLDEAIDAARSVEAPAGRAVALLEVAARLHRSGDEARAGELVSEAVPLLPPQESEEPGRQIRMAAAVHLALIDPDRAMTLWPWGDEIEANSQADRLTASMAARVAAADPDGAWRLLQLTGPYYRDRFAPRVAFKMAAVDLPQAEQVAALMRGPAGRVFVRVAIAAALSETSPEQATGRLLNALDQLEHLADRGYRSGGSEAPLLNVGLALLPWIERLAPERTDDSFWRVLALRDSSYYAAGYVRRFGHLGSRHMFTADPVTATLISHFDVGLARTLLMPPDDTVTGPVARGPYFFLAALTVVDPQAALVELRTLADDDAAADRVRVEACRYIMAMLDRSGWDRWNWISLSLHGLSFE